MKSLKKIEKKFNERFERDRYICLAMQIMETSGQLYALEKRVMELEHPSKVTKQKNKKKENK